MNAIQKLHQSGQSLWYDNIQRRLLENGELAERIAGGKRAIRVHLVDGKINGLFKLGALEPFYLRGRRCTFLRSGNGFRLCKFRLTVKSCVICSN